MRLVVRIVVVVVVVVAWAVAGASDRRRGEKIGRHARRRLLLLLLLRRVGIVASRCVRGHIKHVGGRDVIGRRQRGRLIGGGGGGSGRGGKRIAHLGLVVGLESGRVGGVLLLQIVYAEEHGVVHDAEALENEAVALQAGYDVLVVLLVEHESVLVLLEEVEVLVGGTLLGELGLARLALVQRALEVVLLVYGYVRGQNVVHDDHAYVRLVAQHRGQLGLLVAEQAVDGRQQREPAVEQVLQQILYSSLPSQTN